MFKVLFESVLKTFFNQFCSLKVTFWNHITKMKVLQYNQYYLNVLGLSSDRLTEQTDEFLKTMNCYVLLFGLGGLLFPCSAIFGINHVYNIKLALKSLLLVCGCLQCVGSYISIGIKMKKVKQMHLKIQDYVDNGNFFILHCNSQLC